MPAWRPPRASWAAFLDSDDEWLPDHLANLWELRGDHSLVGSAVLHRSSAAHGSTVRWPEAVVLNSPDLYSGRSMSSLRAPQWFGGMRLALGGFNEWWGVEDIDLWVRCWSGTRPLLSPDRRHLPRA